MSDPVLGLQHYIRMGKRLLLQMMTDKDKPPELRMLLKHSRHQRIKFVQRGGYKTFVVDQNIIMDGLTRRLKGSFWKSSTTPKVKQGDTKTKVTVNTGGCYHGGISRRHGQRAHSDFARIVKCMTSQTTQRKGGSHTVGKVDACAFRMFMTLIRKRIVPVICEMAVFDEYLRIATAIDCIAYDLDSKRVIAIEIKTGSITQRDYSAHRAGKTLLTPLHDAPDSPLNRAWIQLLTTLLMVKRRYGVNIHDGLVVRPLGQTGRVQTYKIPKWMKIPGYQHTIYKTLKNKVMMNKDSESRSFNVPATKQVRSKFNKDREQQRAKERMSDPKADVFWERIPPTKKRTVQTSVPAPIEPTEEDMRDIDSDCPPPYMVRTESIPIPTQNPNPNPIEIDLSDEPEPTLELTPEPELVVIDPISPEPFSWESVFGLPTASPPVVNSVPFTIPALTGCALTWDQVERQLRESMRCHG